MKMAVKGQVVILAVEYTFVCMSIVYQISSSFLMCIYQEYMSAWGHCPLLVITEIPLQFV